MRVFYDCEFFEDGEIIDLISIGFHADDGREFYAVNEEFNTQRMLKHPIAPWLLKNVFNSINHERIMANRKLVDIVITDPNAMPKSEIGEVIIEFLTPYAKREGVELWAYYGAYDHVALAQIWGRMLDMPSEIVPMYTNDIMTISAMKGHPRLPAQIAGVHNALGDARHDKVKLDYLLNL